MRSVQAKTLEHISDLITKAGYEPVERAQYSNTGTVRAMDGFRTDLTIAYDFQDNSATIYTNPLPTKDDGATGTSTWPEAMPYQRVPAWIAFYVKYDDQASFERVFSFIARTLRAQWVKQYRHEHIEDEAGVYRGVHEHAFDEGDNHVHPDEAGKVVLA